MTYRDSYGDETPDAAALPAPTITPARFAPDGSHDVISTAGSTTPRAHANLVRSIDGMRQKLGNQSFLAFVFETAEANEAFLRATSPDHKLLKLLDDHREAAKFNGGRGLIPE